MFDTAFRRLVWKECRAQWQIWFALIVGTILLQMLYLAFGRDFQQSMTQFPLAVALVLTACYAVTSPAILFAGEREEETDNWLRQLPLTSRQLFSGKATFTALSVVAFALIALGTGLITELAARGASTSFPDVWADQEWTIGFLQGAVGLVLWSVFYSLLLSRVIAVLLAAVATHLFVAGIAGNFLPKPFEAWMSGIGICLIIADIWLAKQWQAGRTVVPVFKGRRVATDRRSQIWLRGVTWAATRTPLAARTMAVLAWRELRGAVPFAIEWGLCGVVMVDLLFRVQVPTNVIWLLATPVLCGVMACAGDNWRQTFRFLTDRGLNPMAVWLTKHIIWLTLAVALVVVFGAYDAVTTDRISSSSLHDTKQLGLWGMFGNVIGLFFRQTGNLSVAQTFKAEMYWRHVSMICSLGFLLYAVGFLCSLWFRRVAVAVSVAAVTGAVLVGWHVFVGLSDISFAYATWPLVVTTVAASLATVSGWLYEATGWRRKLTQAAWIIVPVVSVSLASMWYRANQIPVVALDFDWHATRDEMQRLDSRWSARCRILFDDLETLFVPYISEFTTHKQRWFLEDVGIPVAEAAEADGGVAAAATIDAGEPFRGDLNSFNAWTDLLDFATHKRLVDELIVISRELADSEPRIDPKVWESRVRYSVQRTGVIGPVIGAAAHAQTVRDDLDEAWRTLEAGLTLTEYLPNQLIDVADLQGCWWAQETILQEIHAWAAHPDQTADRLQIAKEAVNRLTNSDITLQPLLRKRYAYYRDQIETRTGTFSAQYWLPSSEYERVNRLMAVLTIPQKQEVQGWAPPQGTYSTLNLPWVSPDITPPHILRWAMTTPRLPADFYYDATIDLRPVSSTILATKLILDLHRYRLQHGEFPASLDMLIDETGGTTVDPYNGENFGYAPNGFPAPALLVEGSGVSEDFIVPAETPLLWSNGGTQGSIVRSASGTHYISTVGVDRNDLSQDSLIGAFRIVDERLVPAHRTDRAFDPVKPSDVKVKSTGTNRILFVILGRRSW